MNTRNVCKKCLIWESARKRSLRHSLPTSKVLNHSNIPQYILSFAAISKSIWRFNIPHADAKEIQLTLMVDPSCEPRVEGLPAAVKKYTARRLH